MRSKKHSKNLLCNTIRIKKVETKLSSKKSTKPTKSLETNLNVDSTITTEAEVVDSDDEISVALEDSDDEEVVDLILVMLLAISLVDDFEEVEEDLVSAKVKT